MKAVVFETFGGKLNIQDVKKPTPKSHGGGYTGKSHRCVPQRLAWLDGA
jgi:hypothetical protein